MSDYHTHAKQMAERRPTARQRLLNSNRWLDYSIEAMESSDPKLTEHCVELFNDLKTKLNNVYSSQQIFVDCLLVGGASQNTQISDSGNIDMMIIYRGNEAYQPLSNEPLTVGMDELIILREITKKTLKSLFPEALLDDSQPLALTMSNPSQSCNFCLYFSFWHNYETTASGINSYSGEVLLLNKESLEFELTNPLKTINEINSKDGKVKGNEKSLVRILKNLKADSTEPINLSGYFITCLVHSMEDYTLDKPPGQLLFLLLECSLYFKRLSENPFLRRVIRTPDGLSQVFQGNEALLVKELEKLKNEMDLLIKHLVLEIDLYTNVKELVTINS